MNDLAVKVSEEFVWVKDPQQEMIDPLIGTLEFCFPRCMQYGACTEYCGIVF